METHYTFNSDSFTPTADELDEDSEDYINPGIYGRQLADYLKIGLRERGYKIKFRCAEDWGFWQEIEHNGGYMLAVGCANYEEGHRIFVQPDKPVIRRWLRKIDVREDVEALVAALGKLLKNDPDIRDVRLADEP